MGIRSVFSKRHNSDLRGFTLIEIVVVLGILGVLASMIFPAIATARNSARKAQCTSQLRQLGQALSMYSIDHNRGYESYPDFVTDLYRMQYAADQKIFVCPMDPSKATYLAADNNKPSLKPIYTLSPPVPIDDKSSWAERLNLGHAANCSYLYEFSTRPCERYDNTDNNTSVLSPWIEDSPSTFGYNNLAAWDYDFGGLSLFPPDPWDVRFRTGNPLGDPGDQFETGQLSWQDVKFWQMRNGDVYNTGIAYPGDSNVLGEEIIPASWSPDPYNQITAQTAVPQHGYPRNWIPIVRCFWHMNVIDVDNQRLEEVLNLAVDGNIFQSAPGWEETAWRNGRQADDGNTQY